MEGRIVKGIGGFYYVAADGALVECRACGRFRKENIKPLAGDYVEFSMQNGSGYIEAIRPRQNELARPAVANVDLLALTVAALKPHIDFMLCDKLLVQAARAGIPQLLCVNKSETSQKSVDDILRQYAAFDVLCVSAKDGSGLEQLKQAIRGKCVCFTGQSAVGKSSLINAISTQNLEVGGMSKKTDRGKHTTRATELIYLPDLGAYVLDTPGFSMLDLSGVKRNELAGGYPEFTPYAGECRFSSCLHQNEPDCAVKIAVAQNKIPKERYERYLRIWENMEERYD